MSASSAAVTLSGRPAGVLQQQFARGTVAGDVDDVPAFGLFEDVPQPVAGNPVLQNPHFRGLPAGGDARDQPDQGLALAAQVQRLTALGQAEQPEHAQPVTGQVRCGSTPASADAYAASSARS